MDKSEYREKRNHAERMRQEAAEAAYRRLVIGALQKIAEQDKAAEHERNRADRFHRRVEKLTLRLEERRYRLEIAETAGLWVAAFVGLLAIYISSLNSDKQRTVMEGQLTAMTGQLAEIKSSRKQTDDLIEANKELAEAAQTGNRAWISPRFFSIDGAVKDGQPIIIKVLYDNAGKTPALDVEFHTEGRMINSNDGSPLPVESYRNLKMGKNGSCNSKSTVYAGVVYPASNTAGYISKFATGEPNLAARVRARTTVLAIQGCYRYNTQNSQHKSAFCSYLEPDTEKPLEQWQFKDCADGNYAD